MTIDRDSFKAFVKALSEAQGLEPFMCCLLILTWFMLSRERLSSGTQGLVPKHQVAVFRLLVLHCPLIILYP